jgi:hypothetical protein
MEEITPTKAPRPQSFPTGAIIKEAWQICTTYFWPLTMALLVIQIPEKIVLGLLGDDKSGGMVALYEMLISGFVIIGIYRSIYHLKSDGTTPSFSRVYAEGLPFYWRNLLQILLVSIYSYLIVLGIAAIVAPSVILMREPSYQTVSYLLISATLIAGFVLLAWWAARIFICRAALSDDLPGANKAIAESMRMTKGKVLMLTPTLLCIIGIFVTWLVIQLTTHYAITGDLEVDAHVSSENMVKIGLITLVPSAFAQVLSIAIIALTYLRLKESAKLVGLTNRPPTIPPA